MEQRDKIDGGCQEDDLMAKASAEKDDEAGGTQNTNFVRQS